MKHLFRAGALAGLTLSLAGCSDPSSPGGGGGGGGGGEPTNATTGPGGATTTTGAGGATMTTSTGTGMSDPTVTMEVTPTTMAAGDDVEATVTVTNFEMKAIGGADVAGQGHYHVYLDSDEGDDFIYTVTTAPDSATMDTATFQIPASTSPGPHVLHVILLTNNHVPLDPAVEDFVDITVQ